MTYSPPSQKPLKKVIKGLASIVLGAGLTLHAVEFIGGLILFNKIESGDIEITLDDEEIAAGIKDNKTIAKYIADKTISEVNEPDEYFFVGGLKLAALAYKSRN